MQQCICLLLPLRRPYLCLPVVLPFYRGRAKATTPVMEEGREEETPGAGTRQLMGQRTA